jgi:hypothetical protein
MSTWCSNQLSYLPVRTSIAPARAFDQTFHAETEAVTIASAGTTVNGTSSTASGAAGVSIATRTSQFSALSFARVLGEQSGGSVN